MPLPLVVRLDAQGDQPLPYLYLGFPVDCVTGFGESVPHVLQHQDQLLRSDLPISGFGRDLPKNARELGVRYVGMRDVVRENRPEPRDRGAGKPSHGPAPITCRFVGKIGEKVQWKN